MTMRVDFVPRTHGPERLVSEAEIIFGPEAGPLEGLKLVGISLWHTDHGDVFVTLPSRAFGGGVYRRYFDLLRTVNGNGGSATKRLKAHILDAWTAHAALNPDA